MLFLTNTLALAMPLIDIGANLADDSFAPDLGAVLNRASAAGIEQIIVTGSSLSDERLRRSSSLFKPDCKNLPEGGVTNSCERR